MSNIPVSLNNRPDVSLEAIDESRVMAGAYFSYPFTRRWSLGCKALAGYSYILDRSIGRDEIKLGNNGFAWSAGVSVGYVLKRNFGARLFCDYSSTSTSLGLSPSTELGIMDISSKTARFMLSHGERRRVFCSKEVWNYISIDIKKAVSIDTAFSYVE